MSEENPFKIVLEYDMFSAFHIKKYRKWIQKHVDKGDKIPARVIKKFISFFKTEEQLIKVKVKIINQIIRNTLERFKKYNYNFQKEKSKSRVVNFMDDNLMENLSEYSLEKMLESVLIELITLD